jgi:hypothetical protein
VSCWFSLVSQPALPQLSSWQKQEAALEKFNYRLGTLRWDFDLQPLVAMAESQF